MLHSQKLLPYSGALSSAVEVCLEEIKDFFRLPSVAVLQYDVKHIAVPVVYSVSIPPMGTVNGVDIREAEPVLIKISLTNYPKAAPLLLSDRIDFPKEKLAHLYVTRVDGEPAKLCVVRNNLDEWFASRRMGDLLAVGAQWFFKAAIGRLTDDGDEFDPTRLEGYAGHHIYQYSTLLEIVENDARFLPGYSMAILFSCVFTNEYKEGYGLTYKTLSAVPFIQIAKVFELIQKINQDVTKQNEAAPLLSLLVWREDGKVEEDYCTQLPSNYGALKAYFKEHGIAIEPLVHLFVQNGYQLKNGIPLIHALKRPKKMVGYAGQYEFINFVIHANDFKVHHYPHAVKVTNQSHLEPFSQRLAEKLTGEQRRDQSLFIGAGSVGSKLIIHDARSGKLTIGAVDPDELQPHNLARHPLFATMIGLNKAKATMQAIAALYATETTKGYKSFPISITDFPLAALGEYNWLVDTSASTLVQNWLATTTLPESLTVSRCELVDEGRLGLLYVEGRERNPRIDDLINLTYYYAVDNQDLQNWRKRDAAREVTHVDIGLGCSSTTTVMADDIISYHVALFSRLLGNESKRATIKEDGLLFISSLETTGIPQSRNQHYLIKPFDSYTCQVGSGWEIRFISGATAKLFELAEQKSPVETGGVLVGLSNYKTKTIHVFDVVEEPIDSQGTYCEFTRGVRGLPAYIDTVKEKTGSVVGYIGEWHTHPMGLETLSAKDTATIAELIVMNRNIPIPTCALIVTTTKILPFVFE